jgi:hypothetical protein
LDVRHEPASEGGRPAPTARQSAPAWLLGALGVDRDLCRLSLEFELLSALKTIGRTLPGLQFRISRIISMTSSSERRRDFRIMAG